MSIIRKIAFWGVIINLFDFIFEVACYLYNFQPVDIGFPLKYFHYFILIDNCEISVHHAFSFECLLLNTLVQAVIILFLYFIYKKISASMKLPN
jgi:uncharacterized membrane protein YhdT